MKPVHFVDAALRDGNTSLSAQTPLTNGSANPSVFNVAENAIALAFTPTMDLKVLRPISDHLMRIAKREGLPIGITIEYAEAHYKHQVLGGMISNLRHQLTQINMLERLN